MIDPRTKTKIIHSETKDAFNIIGRIAGKKYKIARVPYLVCDDDKMNIRNKKEALVHADFIDYCFNNSEEICKDRS